MKTIEAILRERIGLDCSSTGPTALDRVVRRRMATLGLSLEEYQRRLSSSAAEFAELIETVLVAETWFFRDPEAFTAMTRLGVEEWLPRHQADEGTLRILSLPCSSGEEPYSIAMGLLDGGFPAGRFQIDAMDVSTRVLNRAKKCVYGKHAFRGKDLAFRTRHFRQVGEEFVLNGRIRQLVDFSAGNLLGPNFTAPHANYDFIFFRNLLVYLDGAAQARALERMQSLLSPTGMLFVGSAELPVALDHGFTSAALPLAFACRKRNGGGVCTARAYVSETTRASETASPSPSTRPGLDLAQARRLADAGRLSEAATLCEEHLRDGGCSAQAYYLLGLVQDSRGDATAMDSYRKALYLDPNHYEALTQLALLAQRDGNTSAARNLQRRALRSHPEE